LSSGKPQPSATGTADVPLEHIGRDRIGDPGPFIEHFDPGRAVRPVRLDRRHPTAVQQAVLDQRGHHLADRSGIYLSGRRQVNLRPQTALGGGEGRLPLLQLLIKHLSEGFTRPLGLRRPSVEQQLVNDASEPFHLVQGCLRLGPDGEVIGPCCELFEAQRQGRQRGLELVRGIHCQPSLLGQQRRDPQD
jgi:hypothetical protein